MQQLSIAFPKEIWKPVVGYEGKYEVSSEGRVRSISRWHTVIQQGNPVRKPIKGRVLKDADDGIGYRLVNLRGGSNDGTVRVHQLVALAFFGYPPGDIGPTKWQVNHKDGNKANNHLSNLEWVTHLGNMQHASRTGLVERGEDRDCAKLTRNKVVDIRRRVAEGEKQCDLAEEYEVSRATVCCVVKGTRWGHVKEGL